MPKVKYKLHYSRPLEKTFACFFLPEVTISYNFPGKLSVRRNLACLCQFELTLKTLADVNIPSLKVPTSKLPRYVQVAV